MDKLLNFCRVCLQLKSSNVSLYLHKQQKYIPSVIENLCGVVLSSFDEPQALICKECAEAIINADAIIQKCQESDKLLSQLKNNFDNDNKKYKIEEAVNWLETAGCKRSVDSNAQNFFIEPEMLVQSVLEDSLQDNSNICISKEEKTKKSRTQKSRLKVKSQLQHPADEKSEENPAALLYQSHFKTTKPKKPFVRSREQYLKRKIRNYPVKEPLKLIGGAGVVRKRKPKSYHRAIPNFYFRCELCHEFESNVASYAVTHLNTVHSIERPAIFRCLQCDAKPFIKNQSLQEHIATIHEQQPKKRDFICQECSKTFIKNCHLQKHLLSVHKMGEMPYKCEFSKCGKGFVDSHALRLHLKLSHHVEYDEKDESLTTLYQCDLCGKSFMDLQTLNDHIKNIHTGKGFNCLQCVFDFRECTLRGSCRKSKV